MTGTGIETLFKALEETKSHTIKVDREGPFPIMVKPYGKEVYWELSSEKPGKPMKGKDPILAHGHSCSSLYARLEQMIKEENSDERFTVLMQIGAEPMDGVYQTHWTQIDPCFPYEVKDDTILFSSKKITLSAAEEAQCAESNLALYDEFQDVLYPISEASFDTAGRWLGCKLWLKQKPFFPLGIALMIAERLIQKPCRFLYHEGTKKVKPLVAIVSSQYQYRDPKVTIQESLSKIVEVYNQRGYNCITPEVVSWSVGMKETKVLIQVGEEKDRYTTAIEMQTLQPLSPTQSMSSYAITKDGARILLASIDDTEEIDTLFDAIEEFNTRLEGKKDAAVFQLDKKAPSDSLPDSLLSLDTFLSCNPKISISKRERQRYAIMMSDRVFDNASDLAFEICSCIWQSVVTKKRPLLEKSLKEVFDKVS